MEVTCGKRLCGVEETEALTWIANATYLQLLEKWRFEPAGSPWFQGEVGKALKKRFDLLRNQTSHEELVAASKLLGFSNELITRCSKLPPMRG